MPYVVGVYIATPAFAALVVTLGVSIVSQEIYNHVLYKLIIH